MIRIAPKLYSIFAAAWILAPFCLHASEAEVTISRSPEVIQVRYASGGERYVEESAHGRWVGHWGADSATISPELNAFEIRILTEPSRESTLGTLVSGWQVVSARELGKTERGARHVAVELSSTEVPMRVVVHTLLDGTAVMKRWLDITNRSAHPIALTSMFPWTGRVWSGPQTHNLNLGYPWRQDWTWEGWLVRKYLTPGANVFYQQIGLSFAHPYFNLLNEGRGEYLFGQLEWPLNRVMEFDNNDKGVSFKFGPTAANALRVMDAGETVTTPAIHLGFITGDFDTAVQAMHDHIRRSVLTPPEPSRAYRIECLMPEDQPATVYRGKDFNETNIKKFMEVASDLGVELFILDGPMWCANYGDWLKPRPEEFPNGLKPLVDFAHQHNMLFGLYAEPEGGRDGYTSPNTSMGQPGLTIGPWSQNRAFQQHQDWFWLQGRVLNLSNPDAAAYMEDALTQIVGHYGIDLYRHDFNMTSQGEGTVTERHGFVESDYWRQYEAFHRDFAQLHEKFPRLILQQAAGGSSRLDLATVANFPENYTSDRANMPFVYRMLSGITVYMPPEALVTPIGMWDANSIFPEGHPDLDTMLRSVYTLGNTPMIFNSLVPKSRDELTPQIRDKFLHYTKIYRDFIRPIISRTQVYHHAPVNAGGNVESGDWFAMEFAAPDRSKGWAVVIRLIKDASGSYLLKPRGLDAKKRYAVTIDTTGKTEIRSGADIARDGLRIQPKEGDYSELVLFTAQSSG